MIPGVCTPTEIEAALTLGLSTLKFFPAEAVGGVAFLKSVSAVYVPCGSCRPAASGRRTCLDYLALPARPCLRRELDGQARPDRGRRVRPIELATREAVAWRAPGSRPAPRPPRPLQRSGAANDRAAQPAGGRRLPLGPGRPRRGDAPAGPRRGADRHDPHVPRLGGRRRVQRRARAAALLRPAHARSSPRWPTTRSAASSRT